MNVDGSLMPLPASPPWATRYRSDDLDEVREWVTRAHGEHSRVAHAGGPIGFELASLSGDAVLLGWGAVSVAMTLRGAVPLVLLHLPIDVGMRYRIGRNEHLLTTDMAILIAPGQHFTRRSAPGQTMSIAIDPRRLAAEVSARAPSDGREIQLRSGPIVLDASSRTRFGAALAGFMRTSAPQHRSRRQQHGEAQLLDVVASALLQHDAVGCTRPITARRLGDLEAWIDAHLGEPITLGKLCAVAGVGGRALAKIFEARRGMSPMRFVTERRLAAVHQQLLAAGVEREVTEIAGDLGFTHMGRFAIAYREVFGESPSQTLWRNRRTRDAVP